MDQFLGDALSAQRGRFAAQLFDQPQRLRKLFPVGVGKFGVAGRFDVDGHPRRFQARRHAAGGADQPAGKGAWPDADQQPLAGGPRAVHGVLARDTRPSARRPARPSRRRASSRRAIRLPLVKKLAIARSASRAM